MPIARAPTLTLGIEEEYLLVDMETRDLVATPPPDLMENCEELMGQRVANEFLQAQIEVGTGICNNITEARAELEELRSAVASVTQEFGIAPIAASSHPSGDWTEQVHTPKERYDSLLRDLGGAARRMLICGMHVHAGVEDNELRIDLMNQISYFLPHILALSTSSPFWNGHDMGMMSYRTIVFDALPRTGLPPRFASFAAYEDYVDQLVRTGTVEDGTKLWWDLRPSARFPTLEVRCADVCTRLDDALSIAAIYQCLLRRLYKLRRENQTWRDYDSALIEENRWRALRYGADGEMIDFGKVEVVAFSTLIEELLMFIHEEAEELGCLAEISHAREIVRGGTSAHRQLHVYNAALAAGADREEAFRDVVDHLIEETLRDVRG